MKRINIFCIFTLWLTFSGVVIGCVIPSIFSNNNALKNNEMIQEKKCYRCDETKSLIEFYKHSGMSDGHLGICIKCHQKNSSLYVKTKKGLIFQIYSHQKSRSKKRSHIPPNYTKLELLNSAINSNVFIDLYNKWVASDYDKNLTPSFDRNIDSKPYSFDNCKWMTWDDNNQKARESQRKGELKTTTPHKAVIGVNIKSSNIVEYISISQASRELNIAAPNISSCCLNKKKVRKVGKKAYPVASAGGYKWMFK